MKIVTGSIKDCDEIFSLYVAAQKELVKEEIYQWDQYEPTKNMIQEDLEGEHLFVAQENEEIYGAIVLDEEDEPEHDSIDWQQEGKALYLHRLVVHPRRQGNGTGKRLLTFADEFAAEFDYECIRLDAYRENKVARNLYQSYGYKEVGKILCPRRDVPFICYEKEIPSMIRV